MKKIKSLLSQLQEESKPKLTTGSWDAEGMLKYIEDIFYKRKKEKKRNVVWWRYCKGVGGVIEESFDNGLHVCNDLECIVCSIYREEIKSFPFIKDEEE